MDQFEGFSESIIYDDGAGTAEVVTGDTEHDESTGKYDDDFAADVALTCSRFFRVALFRAGFPPSSATWRVLRFIDRHQPVRISDVARRERSTMATVSTLINRLQNQGLVEKTRDLSDTRQVLLTMTNEGRRQCEEWQSEIGKALAPDFDDLSEEQRHALRDAVEILKNMSTDD